MPILFLKAQKGLERAKTYISRTAVPMNLVDPSFQREYASYYCVMHVNSHSDSQKTFKKPILCFKGPKRAKRAKIYISRTAVRMNLADPSF